MKISTRIILTLALSLITLQAQTITNVQVRQEGLTIIITYDMSGALKSGAEIKVAYSTDNGKTYLPISDATGDVGDQVTPGSAREIYWPVTDSSPTGKDVRFTVWPYNPPPPGMVYVEGGIFQMGSNSGDGDEKPVHTVTVKSFFMDKTEVTQAEYRRVMGKNPSNFSGCDECPVETVSWDDAMSYAHKVGKRLPTEAEWEYAARGGNQSKGTIYSGSNDLGSVGWYSDNSGSKTHPVGQKQPNELGLYDMSGNVWEWCADWYAGDYYSQSPGVNPPGPASGPNRVLRGGSWLNVGYYCRVANRSWSLPVLRDLNLGFRCIQDF